MTPQHDSTDTLLVWKRPQLRDYSLVAPLLPVTEAGLTQIGAGHFACDADIIKADDVTLARIRHHILSVGTVVLDPAYIGFTLVKPTTAECRINGEEATPSTIFVPGPNKPYYVSGAGRDVIVVTVPRVRFVAAISALRGFRDQDEILKSRLIELAPSAARKLRDGFLQILEMPPPPQQSKPPYEHSGKIAAKITGLICEAYLSTTDQNSPGFSHGRSMQWIVRTAEERFLAAEARPVTLADLCVATGVSKSTLYNAFHHICGDPPLEFFRKRRMMQARTMLMNSRRERGIVKRAALTAGMTQLGRFSVEYRKLFGESPSATLNDLGNALVLAD